MPSCEAERKAQQGGRRGRLRTTNSLYAGRPAVADYSLFLLYRVFYSPNIQNVPVIPASYIYDGRVAPGGDPPRAPTDPYVHTLMHTVPPIMGSQRERTPSGPPSPAAAAIVAADD